VTDLLTREGRERLKRREGVADMLERHRWGATLVAAMLVGAPTALAVDLAGFSTLAGILIGLAVALTVVAFYAIASLLTRTTVVPELARGENEPGELAEELRFDTCAEAEREATRRNRVEGSTGAFWIEVEHPEGGWGVELRGRRRGRPAGVADAGASGIWIDGGGFGGGGGGDGG
jgi:hypothetical protein